MAATTPSPRRVRAVALRVAKHLQHAAGLAEISAEAPAGGPARAAAAITAILDFRKADLALLRRAARRA